MVQIKIKWIKIHDKIENSVKLVQIYQHTIENINTNKTG